MLHTLPFFSIIIPTYNRSNLIGNTIKSVIDQQFDNWEVLIVDDGSTDDTQVVVASLTDLRIRYLPKVNAERGAARNYGLARAKGIYALFLDSDDCLHPNHLLTLHKAIYSMPMPPNFIATKYDFERAGLRRPSDLASITAEQLDFDTFLSGNILACNICIRRQNPQLFLFEEDRRYAAVEDWMFMLQNTQHGDTVQLVDAVTVTMNDHDERSMRADNQGLIKRLELASTWMQQNLSMTNSQCQRLLGRIYYLCAIHAHIDGYQLQAITFARRALKGLPTRQAALLLLRTLVNPTIINWLKNKIN